MHLLNAYLAFHYVHGRFREVPGSVREYKYNSYNRFLYVDWPDTRPSWLIKQPLWQYGSEHLGISNEAAINEVIAGIPDIKNYVPAAIDYDPTHRILITERNDLDIPLAGSQIVAGSKDLIATMAKMMAEVHFYLTRSLRESESKSGWYHFKPGILINNIGHFNPILENVKHSFVRRDWLRSLLLTTGFQQVLEKVSLEWESETAIHGDLHWNNILVSKAEPVVKSIRLCDWEFAGFGDKNWDFGCFFEGLLDAYFSRRISWGEIIEAGRLFFETYSDRGRELSGVSPIAEGFESWFKLVLRLAGIDCVQKLLKLDAEHTGSSNNTLEPEKARIERLVNEIITNEYVLTNNW